MINLSTEQIKKKLKEDFTYWYHKIDLGNGVVTPGFDYDPLWDNIRKTRELIDYKDKKVLDIAAFDGLFSFEAEKLGAEIVVSTDCFYRTFNNFLFCKQILESKCIPYYNISAYNLFERLDVFFQENYDSEKPYDRLFDVVQHLGLFYHLRDPFLSLSQARSCVKTGGHLLIETNIIMDCDESFMLYNGIPFTYRFSKNPSVWWVPTTNCLKEMLIASFFEPVDDSISIVDFDLPLSDKDKQMLRRKHPGCEEKEYKIGRLCMVAKAVAPDSTDPEFSREMLRTFRNPGLDFVEPNLQK
jgi:SAM-dependent methyltransferase